MSIDEIIQNDKCQMSNAEGGYILYPNPNYTPITDTLPDGTLVAFDAVSGLWATRDKRIYRKSANGQWIAKFISIWDKYVRRPNNHSRYPHVSGNGKMLDAHAVIARAWLGPIPEGYQTDHIDGNNRNFSIDNLRLLPTWMNHRDGGFIKKLRHKMIDSTMFSRPFLLRFFQRMALFKSTNPDSAYNNLSHDDLLRLLVSPEFEVHNPADIMEYEMTHHMEC